MIFKSVHELFVEIELSAIYTINNISRFSR